MKTNFRLTCSVLALVLAFAAAAFAQTTGTVEGVVTDPNGGVVKGATVTLTETSSGRSVTTTTSDDGFFTFRSLVPSNYSVMVEQAGFSRATAERVVVQVGTIARADIQLKVGGATENVNVDIGDTAAQVDTSRHTVDGVINARQITNLPLNERNFLDLAVLQPGVIESVCDEVNHHWRSGPLDPQLVKAIERTLRTKLSPRHVPDEIRAVSDIPRTLSGKKLEVPIKRLLAGARVEDVVNPGTLQNPNALFELLAAAKG